MAFGAPGVFNIGIWRFSDDTIVAADIGVYMARSAIKEENKRGHRLQQKN